MSNRFPKQVEAFSYNLFDELLHSYLHNLEKIPISTAYRFHSPLIDCGDETVSRQILNAVVFRLNYYLPFLSKVSDQYDDYRDSLSDYYKIFKDTLYNSELIKLGSCDLLLSSVAVLFHMNTALVNIEICNYNCYLHMLWYMFYDAELRSKVDKDGGLVETLFRITHEYRDLGRIHLLLKDMGYLPFLWFDVVSVSVNNYRIFRDKRVLDGKTSLVREWVKFRLGDSSILSYDYKILGLSACHSLGEMFISTAKVYLDPSRYRTGVNLRSSIRFQKDPQLVNVENSDQSFCYGENGEGNGHQRLDIFRKMSTNAVGKPLPSKKVCHIVSEELCSYLMLARLYGNRKLAAFGPCRCCGIFLCTEFRTENFIGNNYVICVPPKDVDEKYLENGLLANFTQNEMDSTSDADCLDLSIFNTIFITLTADRIILMYLNFKRMIGSKWMTPTTLADLKNDALSLLRESRNGTDTNGSIPNLEEFSASTNGNIGTITSSSIKSDQFQDIEPNFPSVDSTASKDLRPFRRSMSCKDKEPTSNGSTEDYTFRNQQQKAINSAADNGDVSTSSNSNSTNLEPVAEINISTNQGGSSIHNSFNGAETNTNGFLKSDASKANLDDNNIEIVSNSENESRPPSNSASNTLADIDEREFLRMIHSLGMQYKNR